MEVPGFFMTGLLILLGATVVHAIFLLAFGGLPRWSGWIFIAGYAWFLYLGLA
jgi:Ca2+/Na+ antiporter